MAGRKAKRSKRKSKGLESVQDYLPIREIQGGVIETTDGRYIKMLEIEPINFTLRSDEEQFNIISTFASWLKISPMRLQFKSITRKADSDKHVAMIRSELERETDAQCRAMGDDYIRLIRDVGSREALTRRFFLIFEYESLRGDGDDYAKIYSMLQTAEQTARAYFNQCGNSIVRPSDPDEAAAEILYMFFNRRSCVDEPFSSRVNRVVVDTMASRGKIIGLDPVPHIRIANFLAPRGIDLTHYNYIVMDGLYYSFLYIRAGGYPSRVRAGWMSSLVNAGEGVDVDVHLRRENRSKIIDKVAQRIRLNRTKLKGMQDTSTDYEELTNSIRAGYFIKNGIANYNEDLFYMSVFITKYDADYPDNRLTGAVFEVYRDVNGNRVLDDGDELLGEMDDEGEGVYWMRELDAGGYLVRESQAPEGYVLDENAYYAEITTDGEVCVVENEAGAGFLNQPLRGALKIVKTTDDGKVEGFAFRVSGVNGYDMTFTTDANGEILIEGLRIGEYVVTELENGVSEGYEIAEPVTVTLVANETLTVNVHNNKITVDVPKTGDGSLTPWIILIAAGLAGIAGVGAYCYFGVYRKGKGGKRDEKA